MQYVLTSLVSELQIALLLQYLNFSQSPDQIRQVTKELLAPLGRVTGCPGTVFLVGGLSSLPELLARGKAEVTVWSRAQAVSQVPWGAPGRLSEHSRGIIMGRGMPRGSEVCQLCSEIWHEIQLGLLANVTLFVPHIGKTREAFEITLRHAGAFPSFGKEGKLLSSGARVGAISFRLNFSTLPTQEWVPLLELFWRPTFSPPHASVIGQIVSPL